MGRANRSLKAQAEGKAFCDVHSCAKSRQLASCFDCASYPCEKLDNGIFSGSFVEWLEEKLKTQGA